MGRFLRGVMLAVGAALLFAAMALQPKGVQAQNPADQLKEKTIAVNKKMAEAAKLLKENKYEEATAALMEADKLHLDLAALPTGKNAAATLDKSIVTMRKSLETKGAKVPERPKAEAPMAATPAKPGAPAPAAGGAEPASPKTSPQSWSASAVAAMSVTPRRGTSAPTPTTR